MTPGAEALLKTPPSNTGVVVGGLETARPAHAKSGISLDLGGPRAVIQDIEMGDGGLTTLTGPTRNTAEQERAGLGGEAGQEGPGWAGWESRELGRAGELFLTHTSH